MALTAHIPPENPVTGVSGESVKPITEGQEVMATADTQASGGFWSGLDDLTGSILGGIGNIAGAVADREADEIRTGAESIVDSTGDPSDQTTIGIEGKDTMSEPFYKKYQTELLIGGGVLAAMVTLYFITRD